MKLTKHLTVAKVVSVSHRSHLRLLTAVGLLLALMLVASSCGSEQPYIPLNNGTVYPNGQYPYPNGGGIPGIPGGGYGQGQYYQGTIYLSPNWPVTINVYGTMYSLGQGTDFQISQAINYYRYAYPGTYSISFLGYANTGYGSNSMDIYSTY